MSVEIRGVAHPPAPLDGSRSGPADLSRAEIQTTNLAGRPLLHEHNPGHQVGTCLASWPGGDGSLRIAAKVHDPDAVQEVKNGNLRGLSLGTDMVLDTQGKVLYRNQAELSVCGEGRRPGTWIDSIDGRTVRVQECFSTSKHAFEPLGTSPLTQ